MTLQQLKERIRVTRKGYGNYLVTTTYREKEYRGHSNNSLAVDRIDSDDDVPERAEKGFYTLKEAYMALHKECLMENELN